MNTKLNYVQNWLELAKQSNWSVARLARLCGVSVRTLEMFFLKTWSASPRTWLNEQRQKLAVEFLRDGKSVKETATELSYLHAHNFSRQFKKYWGHYPTQADIFRIRI